MLFQEASFVQGGGRFGRKLIPSGVILAKAVCLHHLLGLNSILDPRAADLRPDHHEQSPARPKRPEHYGRPTARSGLRQPTGHRLAKAPRRRPSGVQVWWKAASNRLADRMLTLLRYL
jgi:hypothetical protein